MKYYIYDVCVYKYYIEILLKDLIAQIYTYNNNNINFIFNIINININV